MGIHKLFRIILSAILIYILVPSGIAEDIHIMDIYSDIDSADITFHSGEHYTNITIDAELIFHEKVLKSKHLKIEDISPNTDITKVLFWDITNPSEGFYHTKITLSMDGSVLETEYYNFSYGWQALPKIFIKDIIPDSSGISVILAPYTTQLGSEPILADVEYMLIDGDTVIYRTTDRRVTVVQATPISKDWNVLLENNHHYSTRVKARLSLPRTTVIAQSKDFIARDDARITELYKDETGASATIQGLSQVPFNGSIIFAVSKDGNTFEVVQEKSPILMSGDDETIEVIWNRSLPPGIYELSVKVVGNDGDVVDRWDTIIESKQSGFDNEHTTPTPTQTPGFNSWSAVFSIMVIYLLLLERADRRNG